MTTAEIPMFASAAWAHPLRSPLRVLQFDEDTIITGSSDGIVRILNILPNKLLGVVGEHAEMPIERIGAADIPPPLLPPLLWPVAPLFLSLFHSSSRASDFNGEGLWPLRLNDDSTYLPLQLCPETGSFWPAPHTTKQSRCMILPLLVVIANCCQ